MRPGLLGRILPDYGAGFFRRGGRTQSTGACSRGGGSPHASAAARVTGPGGPLRPPPPGPWSPGVVPPMIMLAGAWVQRCAQGRREYLPKVGAASARHEGVGQRAPAAAPPLHVTAGGGRGCPATSGRRPEGGYWPSPNVKAGWSYRWGAREGAGLLLPGARSLGARSAPTAAPSSARCITAASGSPGLGLPSAVVESG